MTLTEALTQVIIPPAFSIHFTLYQNNIGEQRARVEFKKGQIDNHTSIKEVLLETLPEGHYEWKARNNTLYAIITQCDYQYRITTRITKL